MIDREKISLSKMLYQVQSIKDNSASFLPENGGVENDDRSIWQDDVDVCDAMIEVLTALQKNHCDTVADALEFIMKGE